MPPPASTFQEFQLWPLCHRTWNSKTSNPSLGGGKGRQGSRKLLTGPGLPPHFPLVEPAETSLGPGERAKLFLRRKLKPASAGWTGRSSAKGKSPHPLCDPSRGATSPSTTRPAQGKVRGPSRSAAAGALGRGWVMQSPSPGARTPWWPWGDGSTPWAAAPPPAAFPRSESPLAQNA